MCKCLLWNIWQDFSASHAEIMIYLHRMLKENLKEIRLKGEWLNAVVSIFAPSV